jgi:hypothetical protein
MLMNSSRVYLPLSLAILLAASTTAARAGSSLDPYSYVKAPKSATTDKKKNSTAVVPQVDDMDAPTTYVTMPKDHFEEAQAEKKGGLFAKVPGLPKMGGVAAPFKGMANGSKKLGSGIANATKKSTTVIGSGLKSTGDKIKDGKDSVATKVANKPKKESANKAATSSVDDWYIKGAQDAIAKDNGSGAKKLAKQDGSSKDSGTQRAYLPSVGGKFGKLKLNPFAKTAKADPKAENEGRPKSGFLEAADNPDPEVLAEIQNEKARIAAAKKAKNAKEKFEPIVNLPEDAQKKTTTQHTQVASTTTVNKPAKKSKFGLGSIASFKPGMPGIPGLKKKKPEHKQSIAAAPKKAPEAPIKKQIEESSIALDPNEVPETDIPESAQPSTAFITGDKEIDKATAAAGSHPAAAHQTKTVAAKAPKKNKLGEGITAMKGGLGKLNFMNKKKQTQPQTANKADAAKQM